jgi:predicted nucleic acid-binding protein
MGIPALRSVLLDTSACIYFLDGSPADRRHREVAALVGRAEGGALTIVLSPISVAELLVLPIRESDVEAEAMVRLFVSRLCQVVPATDATASSAALLRSKYGLRLPDAFVLASAVEHAVEGVVGNDAAWKRVEEIQYLHIDDEIEG